VINHLKHSISSVTKHIIKPRSVSVSSDSKQQQHSKTRSKSSSISSDHLMKSTSPPRDTHPPPPPVSIHIEDEDEALTMDGATAAERLYPWRRSSISDGGRLPSISLTTDPASSGQTSSNIADPHIHPNPFTSADFSGAFQKSSEYVGDYATTTKPEEHAPRRHVWDLFSNEPRTRDDKEEDKTETASDERTTRL